MTENANQMTSLFNLEEYSTESGFYSPSSCPAHGCYTSTVFHLSQFV